MTISRIITDGIFAASITLAATWQQSVVKHCITDAATHVTQLASTAGKQGFECLRSAFINNNPVESLCLLTAMSGFATSSVMAGWRKFMDGKFGSSAAYFASSALMGSMIWSQLGSLVDDQGIPIPSKVETVQTMAMGALAGGCLQQAWRNYKTNKLHSACYAVVSGAIFLGMWGQYQVAVVGMPGA